MEGMDHADGNELFSVFQVLVVARWIHFSSVFVLFGSAFFWFYMDDRRRFAGAGGLPRALHATTVLLRVAAPVIQLFRWIPLRSSSPMSAYTSGS